MDTKSDSKGVERSQDFLRAIVEEDLRTGKHGGRVATRFPPEPNGYLHIGHAKSICLNFSIAQQYGGTCNLRFDDTNPVKEDPEYVRAIAADVKWLGFSFPEPELYASDYFDTMYELAEKLIREQKAYVCSLTEEQIREYRGTIQTPGKPSPYTDRPVPESLELFRGMRDGLFAEGTHVLRAKIDMASPNMKMRDPLLYRIKRVHHDRTGAKWNIYPFYDYAHPLSDAIEKITHSICTLEFENNRELYDWVIKATGIEWVSHQYEFARLNLDYTVTSKRKLLQLVQQKYVSGWDDPRMPTLAGMRRRGFTPESIRAFCDLIGVSKHNSVVDIGKLEFCVRDELNKRAPRVLAVLRPLKVTITNYPEGKSEEFEAPYFPPDVGGEGSRKLTFAKELLIEREDFREVASKDFLRLAPGRVIRLRYAYCIKCDEVLKDPSTGEITELKCSYYPDTQTGGAVEGEKVWGVIHWVSLKHSVKCEVRVYDRLFNTPRPDAEEVEFTTLINPTALQVLPDARVEPAVQSDPVETRYQFERQGYFWRDPKDSTPDALVFNRIIGLKDHWGQAQKEAAQPKSDTKTDKSEKPDKSEKSDAARPVGRTKAQHRANTRAHDPVLAAQYARFQSEFGLSMDEADLLTSDKHTAILYEQALSAHSSAKSLAKWIINELPRELGERDAAEVKCSGVAIGELVRMLDQAEISGPMAKQLFAKMVAEGGEPKAWLDKLGTGGTLDTAALEALIKSVIESQGVKVAEYRAGKTGLLGFFVGQVVRASKGQADPKAVQPLLETALRP